MGSRGSCLTTLIILCFFTSTLVAQNISIENINLIKFRADTVVIGNDAGLYKADPFSFQVYQTSFSGENITGYAVDQEGAEWVNHGFSLSKSEGKSYKRIVESTRNGDAYHLSVFLDNSGEGNVLYSTKTGSSKAHSQPGKISNYLYQSGKFSLLNQSSEFENMQVTAVKGNIIGTKGGAFVIRHDKLEFINDPWDVFSMENNHNEERFYGRVNSLEGDEDHLWLGSERGLLVRENNSWKRFTPENAPITDSSVTVLEKGLYGEVWFATQNEVVLLNGEEWTIFNSKNSPFEEEDLPVKEIRNDPYGRTWVGTNRGVWIYDQGQWQRPQFYMQEHGILARDTEKKPLKYLVSPTISTSRLNISTGTGETADYEVFDSAGRTYKRGQVHGKKVLDISNLKKGMFLIRFYEAGEEPVVKRFVKQ